MRPSQHRLATLFIACMPSLACLAAPTTDVPAALAPGAASPAPVSVSTGARPDSRNSDTRTIDLLVEMQQPKAGIQFNERVSRSTGREGLGRTPPALPLQPVQPAQVEEIATSPAGLFGSGATPAVQARTPNVVDRAYSSEAVPARAAGRPSSDAPPQLARWLQWPRDVVGYVRENRGFVLGCTATLLLLAWIGSMVFNRHRG